MKEQAELIGGCLAARCAVSRKMRFPGLDVVFHAAAPAVNVFVEHLRTAARKIGDDEAGIGAVRPRFGACDDTFSPAPARGAVVELLETPHLGCLGSSLETGFGICFQRLDMTAQGCAWRNAEDEIEAIRPAEIDDLGAAIMAIAADQNLRGGPVGPDRAQKAAQEGADFHAAGALGRPQHGGYEPSIAVEHHHGLEAVFVIMRVEQTELLAAMNGVESVVEIEHNPFRHPRKGAAIEIDERPPMPSNERVSGQFSRREMVDCEARSGPDGSTPCASLNAGSDRSAVASLPSS